MADDDRRFRNTDWEVDENLETDLRKYVLQNLRRKEILDFVERDYPQYMWSLGTLSRRLKYFEITYVDYDIPLNQVQAAFNEENDAPGCFLGYRAIHKKIREQHQLAVPRGLVYDVMTLEDPD